MYVPSKDVYAKFIGTFEQENINDFIDKILQGRAGFLPISKEKVNLAERQCEEIKEGINPRRVIYLRIKGKRDIPLTRIGQPLTLEEIEQKAADLARFLQVSIEGL